MDVFTKLHDEDKVSKQRRLGVDRSIVWSSIGSGGWDAHVNDPGRLMIIFLNPPPQVHTSSGATMSLLSWLLVLLLVLSETREAFFAPTTKCVHASQLLDDDMYTNTYACLPVCLFVCLWPGV